MNDLLETGRTAMQEPYKSENIDENFVDNAYFTILKWIIDNVAKNSQIKIGSRILCDYNPNRRMFVLKDVTKSLKNSSNDKDTNEMNGEYVYVCDKERRLIARKIGKAKISINNQVVNLAKNIEKTQISKCKIDGTVHSVDQTFKQMNLSSNLESNVSND